MKTRYQEKRPQILTPDVPPTKRRRSSISNKVKLRGTDRDECNGDRNQVKIIFMQPVVCIPRIEIVAHVNENDQVGTTRTGSEKKMKRSKFASANRSSPTDCFRGHQSNIASDIVSGQMKSLLPPMHRLDDAIIEECESDKPNIDHDNRSLWLLRDVKNVFHLGDSLTRKCGNDDPANLPLLRDQENIFSGESTRKIKKAEGLAVDYVTPLSKELSRNSFESASTKLLVQSKQTGARKKVLFHRRIDEKESVEILSEAEKSVDSSSGDTQKQVVVEETQMVTTRSCKSRPFRSESELTRELSEGHVKNIHSSQTDQSEQSSVRRSPRNLARLISDRVRTSELTRELSEGHVTNIRSSQIDKPEQSSVRRSPRNLARSTSDKVRTSELTGEPGEGDVKNIRSSQIDQTEQSSVRRRPRSLAHSTSDKNAGISKKTVVQCTIGSELSMISNISRRSQKIEHLKEFNDSSRFDHGSESKLISYPLKSSLKSRKKKKKKKTQLNVSFKESLEAMNELPAAESPKTTALTNAELSSTCSPSTIGKIVPSGRQNEVAEPSFYGYPASVDLSSHIEFCSFVLDSFVSRLEEQPKKRMTIREAAEKTEIVNICRKTLENIQRSEKFSQRLATKRMEKSPRVRSVAAEHECEETLPPYVRLTRLSEAEISSYMITPLKDERTPLKSKTEYDYGIDDVNTDDSTDDEDDPKKIVPQWASIAKKTLKKLNPNEKVPRKKIRRWMTPPKLNGITLRQLLFSKCRKR